MMCVRYTPKVSRAIGVQKLTESAAMIGPPWPASASQSSMPIETHQAVRKKELKSRSQVGDQAQVVVEPM